MHTPLRLAIVGFGLVGQRHAAAIRSVEGVTLAAIADPDPEARQAASDLGVNYLNSLDDLLSDTRPDGVVLSTPTPLHAAQGLQCIEAACPVLIEKPISVTSDEAQRLVSASETRDVPVMVGHHRRHNPLIKNAKTLIEQGRIGAIRAVHAQCWLYKPDAYFEVAPWRKLRGAGPVSVNLVHDIDLLRYLCGEIVHVSAMDEPSRRGFETEDVAGALLRFRSGAIGTVSVSDSIPAPWSWELTAREYPVYPATGQSCYLIGGSQGSLSIPDLTLWNQGEKPDWWAPLSATSFPGESADPLIVQIAHFRDVIRGEARPLVSAREGWRTLDVIEAIQRSSRTGAAIALDPDRTP